MRVNIADIKRLIQKHGNKKSTLIPLLQNIQAVYGYIPEKAIELISRELSISPAKIYGVLTFYPQFYLTPKGKHIIKVCQCSACYVMGGVEIFDRISYKLGIKEGETTKDGMFSLEKVGLGCGARAPSVVIDNDFYGKFPIRKIDKILNKYRLKKKE